MDRTLGGKQGFIIPTPPDLGKYSEFVRTQWLQESLTSILAWPIDVWYAAVSECNQLQDEAVAVTAFFAQVNITPMSVRGQDTNPTFVFMGKALDYPRSGFNVRNLQFT